MSPRVGALWSRNILSTAWPGGVCAACQVTAFSPKAAPELGTGGNVFRSQAAPPRQPMWYSPQLVTINDSSCGSEATEHTVYFFRKNEECTDKKKEICQTSHFLLSHQMVMNHPKNPFNLHERVFWVFTNQRDICDYASIGETSRPWNAILQYAGKHRALESLSPQGF